MYNQIFFKNVLRMLEELHMTKNELSDRAGMSISFLSDLTNGKANPSLKIMESIARALDVPLPTLLEMTDEAKVRLDVPVCHKIPRSLPVGLVRIAAILTEYQAYTVRQWNEANKKILLKNNKETSN